MEKLKISFWLWAMFDDGNIYHDIDKRMLELKERGFNTIRMESCAGFFCDPDGKKRRGVKIKSAFGKFSSKVRQFDAFIGEKTFNPEERLLEIFKSADKHNVKVILSSWYFLHTCWFLPEEMNTQIFGLSTQEKMEYFTKELNLILQILRKNNLIHCVAYAEIFNEFDGQDFVTDIGRKKLSDQEENFIRTIHEQSIEFLKSENRDVLFAYDSYTFSPNPNIIPKNIDVLNFHNYYFWGVYSSVLENGVISTALTEPIYPDKIKKYLIEKPFSIDEILAERVNDSRLTIGKDWNSRVTLYSSLDKEKSTILEQDLTNSFIEKYDAYLDALKSTTGTILNIRDKYLPNVKLVMAEGVVYCCSNSLLFEEHCAKYWGLLKEQAKLFSKCGLWGAVVRTTSGPEDPSWELNKNEYKIINEEFS